MGSASPWNVWVQMRVSPPSFFGNVDDFRFAPPSSMSHPTVTRSMKEIYPIHTNEIRAPPPWVAEGGRPLQIKETDSNWRGVDRKMAGFRRARRWKVTLA